MKLVPVTEVKLRATEVIAGWKRDPAAVRVTGHGREAAVMVDLETWNSLPWRLEILDLVAKGVSDPRAGGALPREDAKVLLARFAP